MFKAIPWVELNLGANSIGYFADQDISIWIITDSEGHPIHVLNDKCAHMGSNLTKTKAGLYCKAHGWAYMADGSNQIPGGPPLEKLNFEVFEDVLKVEFSGLKPLLVPNGSLEGKEKLTLLAHASYCLEAAGQKILFDPWLLGDTYWGSWSHFPTWSFDVEDYFDATIVLTHPHPDHFHPQTLSAFPRSTRIVFPNFPSQIIQAELKRLGFWNMIEVEWETPFSFSESLEIAFLRPTSQWEDSAVLVRVHDWIWLNQNDSGAPLADEKIPSGIDLFSSSFDVGASGFPLTWDVSQSRQEAIIHASKEQIIENIVSRAKKLNARYFSPFAGWWRHGLLEHQSFARKLIHTTFEELETALHPTSTKLLETIPSAQIYLSDMSLTFKEEVRKQLDTEIEVKKFFEPTRSLSNSELAEAIESHLDGLVSLSLASNCETLRFSLEIPEIGLIAERQFGNPDEPIVVSLRAEIRPWVAELLVSGDPTATWNHVDIGYWVRWSRTPDIFTANFTRLLQLGYISELGTNQRSTGESDIKFVDSLPISQFLEKDASRTLAILGRAGLPCAACTKSNGDTLQDAYAIHKVPERLRKSASRELFALLHN